jgi:hypothetical protein
LDDNGQWSNVDSDLSEQPQNPSNTHPYIDCDYILTDYHPHSAKNSATHTLSDYGHHRSSKIPPKEEPWKPFRTRLDFELCELALECYLNKAQLEKFITLINQAIAMGPNNQDDGFTIQSVSEVEQLWKLTTDEHVKVS